MDLSFLRYVVRCLSMSITVSDLLRLPSLRQATVLGGRRGLHRVVSSISVLEAADPTILVDGLFRQGEFFGSEIVITGFLNCLTDVERQCANIRRLAEGGEVGLILFYVGIYMPRVDRRLIELADQLDFVLIEMPHFRDLRYGEVISDVTECIYNDRSKSESVVSDILASISCLPEHQRTIATALRMISDRILASVILTDGSFHPLNLLPWPKSAEPQLRAYLPELERYAAVEGEQAFGTQGIIYHASIYPDSGSVVHLFLCKESVPLSQAVQEQVADVVRICINIWGKEHGTIVIRELIRAILQDDSIKMRRLSDIFHIDIASIHEMWILCGNTPEAPGILHAHMEQFCESLRACSALVFADVYEQKLLLFSSTPSSEKAAEAVIAELLAALPAEGYSLSRCSSLQNPAEVREAYLCHADYLADARRIYPRRNWFSLGDLKFVRDCHIRAQSGVKALAACTDFLQRLQAGSEDWDVIDTLSTYLLDTGGSVTRTAEILFLHKNTVKYRLKVISDLLGFRPDKMPDSMRIYEALAIQRLLS